MGELSRELSLGYVGSEVYVDFTCGYGYLPMKLAVSEFTPKSDKLARVPTITTESTDRVPFFQYQYPPPIASRSTCDDLIEKCRSHVKQVVKHQRSKPNPATETGNEISKMVMEAISRYHGSICPSRNVSLVPMVLQFAELV